MRERPVLQGLGSVQAIVGLGLLLTTASEGLGAQRNRQELWPEQRPIGGPGAWDAAPEIEHLRHLLRYRYTEEGDVLFWKMPRFFRDEPALKALAGRAREHKVLVLDLRGDPGSPEDALRLTGGSRTHDEGFMPTSWDLPRSTQILKFMTGSLFEQDVAIGRVIRRSKTEEIVAKSRGRESFGGELFVLVDSGTASDAEVLARIIQLKGRGKIIGDTSAGSGMKSMCNPLLQDSSGLAYGVCIADAKVIMADGKSLEGVGITPDVLVLPTAGDLAAGRDPVLARAVALAGVELDPAVAGQMFPPEWAPF